MIEELYNKIDKFCNETDWSKYLTYEHALEEFIKEIVEEETKELEKENAELKLKVTALENANRAMVKELDDTTSGGLSVLENVVRSKEQLTKAKEIIRTFLNMPMPNNEEVFADVGAFLTKAEQFLKELDNDKEKRA